MSQSVPHVIPYCPRPLQWRFHEERTRFCVLLCHRRFGKTVAAVNDLVRQALRVGRHDWRAAYAAPFLGQAKAVAWDYCKISTAPSRGGLIGPYKGLLLDCPLKEACPDFRRFS